MPTPVWHQFVFPGFHLEVMRWVQDNLAYCALTVVDECDNQKDFSEISRYIEYLEGRKDNFFPLVGGKKLNVYVLGKTAIVEFKLRFMDLVLEDLMVENAT